MSSFPYEYLKHKCSTDIPDELHRDGKLTMSKAIVLTDFGDPSVLRWEETEDPSPAHGEVLIRVRAAGVGPTDVNIRAGRLTKAFPQTSGSILGFEAAGTVVAIGEGVTGVSIGEDVAASLPAQGGYAELVRASTWFPKPPEVSWVDAAALPASAEAAVAALHAVAASAGETLVVLGGGGSVGLLVLQIARAWDLTVIAAASERDAQLIRDLGGHPVPYGPGVFERVAQVTDTVHAVVDAAGKGGLAEAVAATGHADRVVTLSDPVGAAQSGARMLEAGPARQPDALAVTMPLLATGALRLKSTISLPISEAAEAHRLLESGETHDKIVLIVS